MEKERYAYYAGRDYIHIHDNTLEADGSEDWNVISKVFDEDTARRIVACLNACKGFRTQDLELCNTISLKRTIEKLEEALEYSRSLRKDKDNGN